MSETQKPNQVIKLGMKSHPDEPNHPVLHNRVTLAEAVRVSPRTIDNWTRNGMPHLKLSPRMIRFDLGEVLNWMRSHHATRRTS